MAGRADGLNDIFDHDITVMGYINGKCPTPTADEMLANKKYVDNGFVPYTGATGNVDIGTNSLIFKDTWGNSYEIAAYSDEEALEFKNNFIFSNAGEFRGSFAITNEMYLTGNGIVDDTGTLSFNDNNELKFGTSDDAIIKWTTTGTDRLSITSALTDFGSGDITTTGTIFVEGDYPARMNYNGYGLYTNYDLYAGGGLLETDFMSSIVNVSGDLTATGSVTGNNLKATGSGLIWSDGTTGTTPASGAGTRLMWIPAKTAFRAGLLDAGHSTYWDNANIGQDSFAFGLNSRAYAQGGIALGELAFANAVKGIAIGYRATTSTTGTQAVAIGRYPQALGVGSVAIGYMPITNYYYQIAIGKDVVCGANRTYAIGVGHNFTNDTASSFAIGFGQLDYLFTATAADFYNSSITTTSTVTTGAGGITIGGTSLSEAQLQALLALL